MSKKKEELKPCPFCGKGARLQEGFDQTNEEPYWYVVCNNERCTVAPLTRYWDSENKRKAINAWNTRA